MKIKIFNIQAKFFKEMIAVIRAEQRRRASLLTDGDPNFAHDQWLSEDELFINELCLTLLVTLWHQVERELVRLAARAGDEGEEISGQQYQEKMEELRNHLRNRKREGWREIKDRLKLEPCREGNKSMEVLRSLANSYKHDPFLKPDKRLLYLLQLEIQFNYAPLPESDSLREGLSTSIGLGKGAAYCDIAERFVDIASAFLVNAEKGAKLSLVNWKPASLKPSDAAH